MSNPSTSSLLQITPPPTQKQLKIALWINFFAAFQGEFLRGIAAVTGPLFAADMGASDAEIGLVAAGFGITYCFGPTVMGRLIDKIGRRRGLYCAFGCYIMASIFYVGANSVSTLVFAGIIEGIALSFLWPAVGSLTVDLSPIAQKDRNSSIYMSSWNFGSMCGPLLAGFLYGILGAPITFAQITIWSGVTLLLVAAFLRIEKYPNDTFSQPEPKTETPIIEEKTESVQKTGNVPQDHILVLIFGYGTIFLASIYLSVLSSYYAGFAYKYLHLSASSIGIIIFCLPIGRGIAFAIINRIPSTIKSYFIPGLCIIAVVLISLIPKINMILSLEFLFIIAGFISGFAFGTGFSLITEFAPESHRALYLGMLESFWGVSFFIGPLVPFWILGSSPYNPFIFTRVELICLAVLFTILVIFLTKNHILEK